MTDIYLLFSLKGAPVDGKKWLLDQLTRQNSRNLVWQILFLKTDYDWLTRLLGFARGDFEYLFFQLWYPRIKIWYFCIYIIHRDTNNN